MSGVKLPVVYTEVLPTSEHFNQKSISVLTCF